MSEQCEGETCSPACASFPQSYREPVCVISRAVRHGMGHPQGAERLHDFSPDIYLAAHIYPTSLKERGE